MEIPKVGIMNNNMIDIISEETFSTYKNIYSNNRTAIEIEDMGDKYVLPYKKGAVNSDVPGIYDCGGVYYVNTPTESNKEQFLYRNMQIIDLNDSENISEFLNQQDQIRSMEASYLSSSDDVFIPNISADDDIEMRLLKQAIGLKNCDINKYSDRFDQFLNDKRLLKGKSISMKKLKDFGRGLDLKVTITITDADGDIANPMGTEISEIIVGGNEEGGDN